MMAKAISLIVEGDGDVSAAPLLVRRVAEKRKFFDLLIVGKPIKAGSVYKLLRQGEVERYVELALSRNCDGALILLDTDEGCPIHLIKELQSRIRMNADRFGKKTALCFFKSEFESLFLNCIEAYLTEAASRMVEPPIQGWESIRGAKERFRALTKRPYRETVDQVRHTALLDLPRLAQRSRSYQHLESSIAWLMDDTEETFYPYLG